MYKNKHVQYAFQFINLELKRFKEYKTNFYLGLSVSTTYIIIQTIVLYVLSTQFNSLIGWDTKAYLFFLLITNLLGSISGLFYFKRDFRDLLISGRFNNYLTKPLNTLWQYIINSTTIIVLGETIPELILFFIYIWYYFVHLDFLRLFLTIPLFIIGITLEILIAKIIEILAFYLKNNSIFHKAYSQSKHMFYYYPAHIFKGPIWLFSHLFGVVYFAVYTTQFLFHHINYTTYLQVLTIGILIDITLITTFYLLWKKGLEKYEAFG